MSTTSRDLNLIPVRALNQVTYCPRLYYLQYVYAGSRERVQVPFDDALRAKTVAAIEQVRALSVRDVPPEPLPSELRHRCHGCSLATVCLPEETLYQITRPAVADAAPPAAITKV